MPILYLRGYIGLGLIVVGIFLWTYEITRMIAPLIVGFGMGMASTGFQ
jgi:hypothetical protein